MATGWVKDKGLWYYLNESGSMATGWVKDKGLWYYLTNQVQWLLVGLKTKAYGIT
ncbi:cell wall binding repeat family protein [Streptococcus pneumoniae 2080913]|nr:cell wall binding repeat family protein [Streptococcus pneumoniae 2080913]